MDTTINTTANAYYNEVAANYDMLFTDSLSAAENKLVREDLAKLIKHKKSIDVLDMGCGTGLAYELLMEIIGDSCVQLNYTGVDISEEMIRQGHAKHGAYARFIVADIDNLPTSVANRKYDLILSLFGSFSHANRYEPILNELTDALLKPDGDIYLMVYSRYSLKNLWHTIAHFNTGHLRFRQGYNIRNCGVNIVCQAFFYTPKKLLGLIRDQQKLRIHFSSINALFELPFFKRIIRRLPTPVVYFVLAFERGLLYIFPSLGHSLVCQIKKEATYV
jgi:ubiquinone/menaquinone biosynthesis C-methylase UbiE